MRMLWVQLPRSLPFVKQPADAGRTQTGCGLHELPGGYLGKMMVYKSGKVKLRLGDIPFDVSAVFFPLCIYLPYQEGCY